MDDSKLTPKQARSRESQQRILEATLALLETRHFESMTIADIASIAGMAVGNFYKRFKNKEALLPHLYAEYNRRFREFGAAMHAQPAGGGWRQIVEATAAFFLAHRGLIRALHLHARLNPAVVPEGSTGTRAELYQALEPLVTRPGLTAREKTCRARMAALVMVSTLTEAVLYPEMTPAAAASMEDDELVAELSGLLEAYTC